ncbi:MULTISPECIES: sensor histidine kinase [Tenacibaculum]|uniref:sensor histidine kinase n=1 Tax=Tenacibaculum TaxID=104267 RepID=UPI00089D479E|nr:HAMP domain-containing sensor histidine kinase [Tenacibaculum sp. MAR_2010_89]SEE53787.1 Signal transduction histidine kinase [Tenacibaculum sp. MAR_2010_89]
MKNHKAVSNKLILKLGFTFLTLIFIVGIVYISLTFFSVKKFYSETTQRLNANIANHLIEEKFKKNSPFLDDGSVNKSLFGDIMHDMMAVNRAIEVYLLNESGEILYSVVLDHTNPNKPLKKISLLPVKKFIQNKEQYILGDDPREAGKQKIFSAAHFVKNNKEGYIYIILASQKFQQICDSLFTDYFFKLCTRTTLLTMIFAVFIGWLSIWFLTKSLRTIIHHVNKFKEGDLCSRIPNPYNSDLSVLAVTYNNMAQTISHNIKEKESINSFRKELIANVSHDLRTPLTAIRGYIETLKIKEGSIAINDRKEFMDIIEKSACYLSNLVNQLFEYSKLEIKQIEINLEPFYLTNLMLDIKQRYEILAKNKNIKISMIVKTSLPPVMADVKLIERAIQNILDNAIKFTPINGKITIYLSNKQGYVSVKIKDNGPGIYEHDQELIFDRHMKATLTNKEQGIGLGLAIVKKIMELHKTEITVNSYVNKGSVFEFNLPSYNINN